MRKFLYGAALLSSAFLCGEGEEESAFEECAQETCRPHCHCRRRRPTPEEEYLWHERANASWPGKRDDNLIDEYLHQ